MPGRHFCLILLLCSATSLCRGEGFLSTTGADRVPLVVVRGDAYEMGYSLGQLIGDDAKELISTVLESLAGTRDERYRPDALDKAWDAVSPHISESWKQQLHGLARGSGIPDRELIRAHMIPVVGDYSCSGAVIWGDATADGRMYALRNLDYSLDMHMQDHPVVIVYLPSDGQPYVNPTFAGFIGVQTGMNANGLVLTEMGDSPGRDYPFDLNGIPFFTLFSDILYQATSLDQALQMIQDAPRIKKYHYVIGCAKDSRAVKIKAHAPDLVTWTDNDPNDECAPDIFRHVVINPESRAPIAFKHIRAHYGKYDTSMMIDLTKSIPIRGGNLFGVVYNLTDLKMYFAYAKGAMEAYRQPFQSLDLRPCLDYTSASKTLDVQRRVSGK